MSAGSEFTPAQLDIIEDALEDLDRIDISAVPDQASVVEADRRAVEPAVAERLHAYRDVLTLYRKSMPMQEVPASALDAVFAEARRSASATAKPKRLWQRFRGAFVIPALAFAGSAALLVFVLKPEQGSLSDRAEPRISSADQPALAKPVTAQTAKEAAGELPAEVEEEASHEQAGVAAGDAEPEPEAAEPVRHPPKKASTQRSTAGVAKSAELQSGGGSKGESKPRPKPSKRSKRKSKAGGAFPPAAPTPSALGAAPADVSPASEKKLDDKTDAVLALIAKGDAQRLGGDCSSARKTYRKALKYSSGRGRAYAGLGLCELAAGREPAANGMFGQARDADSTVGSFIERERARMSPSPAEPSAGAK